MNERTPREESIEPIVGEIKTGAFSSPLLNSILRHFGRTVFGRSSACMEFEGFLRRLEVRGKTCLEIGTMNGITAIVLSQFFDQVICVSVDVERERLRKHEIIAYLGIKNITFHDVNDNDEKARVINALDFDFAYVDGDHARDTREDFALVKRCGRVLFHEYWPIQPTVWNLVNELPAHEVRKAQYDCFAYWERSK